MEGATGVSQGDRPGLIALTVAILFIASPLVAPLVAGVPLFAPALLIVGGLMMSEVLHIDFNGFTEGSSALMTIIMMPLTSSIASGFGFVTDAALKPLSGRAVEVSRFMGIIAALFVVHCALRGQGSQAARPHPLIPAEPLRP